MKLLPELHRIKTQSEKDRFTIKYFQNEGLPISDYYLNKNKAYYISWNGKMIAGFILCDGPNFRTIDTFAREEIRSVLFTLLNQLQDYTEICCFWINKKYTKQSVHNMLIWMFIGWSIRRLSSKYLIFGTNSKDLAYLYNYPCYTRLIHQDEIDRHASFIFTGESKNCLKGFASVLLLKLVKTFQFPKEAVGLKGQRSYF